MKNIFASIGAVAIGASAVHAAPVTMIDPAKPWSVSASLRGFYDDNYTTATDSDKRDTLGMSVSPTIALQFPMDQTTMGLRYTFGATYYQDREDLDSSNDSWDYTHEIEGFLNHEFSERYMVDIRDSFVIAQDPALLDDSANPYRTNGDNVRNLAEINFTAVLTRQLSLVLGYQNTYVNYDNSGGNAFNPSLSGTLDRMEHLGLINLRWQARKDTVLVMGYNYGEVHYDSSEQIAFAGSPLGPVTSSYRDNRSSYIYGGVDQNFSKDLTLSLRAGAQVVDYYNDSQTDNTTSPYGQVTLSYQYLPGSTAAVGWTYQHSATDVVSTDLATGEITQDQESSVLFASINHRFDAKWSATVNGFWQASTYNGGASDGDTDSYLGASAGLNYQFTRNFAGNLGYSYTTLISDLPNREYDRNVVFVGVTATY